MFCTLQNDGFHKSMKKPYDGGDGYIYGCDGKMFLAVPKPLLPTKGQIPALTNRAALKVVKFGYADEFDIPIKDLYTSLKRYPAKDRCPECNGKKKVDWTHFTESGDSYDRMDTCPVCGGTGVEASNPNAIVPGMNVPVRDTIAFRIKHGKQMAKFYIPLLAIVCRAAEMFGETALHVVAFSEFGCMKLELPNGIIAGIMPCTQAAPAECFDL